VLHHHGRLACNLFGFNSGSMFFVKHGESLQQLRSEGRPPGAEVSLDSFRGKLVIDEGDFRLSDERADVIKILNQGNAKGSPCCAARSPGNEVSSIRAPMRFLDRSSFPREAISKIAHLRAAASRKRRAADHCETTFR
jgi:hypothetical protein